MENKRTKNSLKPNFLTTAMQNLLGWAAKFIRTKITPDQWQQLKLIVEKLWLDGLLNVLFMEKER